MLDSGPILNPTSFGSVVGGAFLAQAYIILIFLQAW